jgi:hypothetical protein
MLAEIMVLYAAALALLLGIGGYEAVRYKEKVLKYKAYWPMARVLVGPMSVCRVARCVWAAWPLALLLAWNVVPIAVLVVRAALSPRRAATEPKPKADEPNSWRAIVDRHVHAMINDLGPCLGRSAAARMHEFGSHHAAEMGAGVDKAGVASLRPACTFEAPPPPHDDPPTPQDGVPGRRMPAPPQCE